MSQDYTTRTTCLNVHVQQLLNVCMSIIVAGGREGFIAWREAGNGAGEVWTEGRAGQG